MKNNNIEKIIQKVIYGLEKNPIYHDFADYAPFLLAFNQNSFIDTQINFLKDNIYKNGVFKNSYESGYRLTDNYEILFGLIEIYRINNDKNTFQLLEYLLQNCLNKFVVNDKIVASRNIKTNIPSFRVSYYCYSIVEVLIDMYDITQDKEYLAIAKRLIFNFFKTPYYQKYNLIPLGSYLFFDKTLSKIRFPKTTFIGKNSSLIFGLIEYYRVTREIFVKQEIRRIFDAIDSSMVYNGIVYRYYRPKLNIRKNPNLAAAFMYINMLNRAFYITKDRTYLDRSETIAEKWIVLQSKIGLFPFNYNGTRSWIDSETDISIALLELYELTGKERYFDCAQRCYQGINNYNLKFSSVDINTGEPESPVIFNSYHTTDKFSGLFLKLCYYFENDKKIFGEDGLYSFLRDR